jgi:lysyl-tRNA synthetase, class II
MSASLAVGEENHQQIAVAAHGRFAMSTLLDRGPGPDKRFTMSESNSADRTERDDKAGARPDMGGNRRAWIPGVASLLCLLIGLSDILAIFKPEWPAKLHRINAFVPGTLTNVQRSADVIIGLMLLLLSHGLRRRKRRAWQAVLALLAFDIVIHVIHFTPTPTPTPHGHSAVAVVAIVELATLLYFHDDFYAVGDPRTRWNAMRVFAGLAVADLAIGLGFLASGGLAGNYSFLQRVQDVIYETVGASGPVYFVSDGRSDFYHLLTSALGLFTLVVTVYLFLRPAQPRARLGESDAAKIRALLAKHGDRDSLGYFALRNDKSVIWSPSGKACVCYRVVFGVMLAAGDPIGDPEAWPGAIGEFLTVAARHAWRPAVMGCSELGAEVWCRESDLTALELGDEAIVSIADFSLSGRAMRNVRQMVTRVSRNGYAAQVRRVRDIPQAELERVIKSTESWRGSSTERGFSMALGRIGGPGDGDCVLVTATQDGVLRAVLHFVPWGADGLSLDLMRRDRSAQPGLNDFLIVESIKTASALGVKRISLNFAMFRAALERGERIGAGPVLRAWRSLLLFMSRWFQIESLYKFNAKFCPVWEPRFFVFPGGRDAPRIALAALEAEAFLVWPRLEVKRLARRIGLLAPLASGALMRGAFPRRHNPAPQSRHHGAPLARESSGGGSGGESDSQGA